MNQVTDSTRNELDIDDINMSSFEAFSDSSSSEDSYDSGPQNLQNMLNAEISRGNSRPLDGPNIQPEGVTRSRQDENVVQGMRRSSIQREEHPDIGSFLGEEDDREDEGPINIDRPREPRRRPVLDDEDDFAPRRRTRADGESFLSRIKIQPKYIAIIAGIIAFFILGKVLDSTSGDNQYSSIEYTEEGKSEEEVNDSGSEIEYEDDTTESSNQYQGSIGGTSIERGEVVNDLTIKYSKEYFADEISVSKFMEFRGGSCIPKIMGYSEILGREIEFQVSPKEYNSYLNGVRIKIEYRTVEYNGVLYVTDIKIV